MLHEAFVLLRGGGDYIILAPAAMLKFGKSETVEPFSRRAIIPGFAQFAHVPELLEQAMVYLPATRDVDSKRCDIKAINDRRGFGC